MIEYNPGGFEVIWYSMRGLFRRWPHDRAAWSPPRQQADHRAKVAAKPSHR